MRDISENQTFQIVLDDNDSITLQEGDLIEFPILTPFNKENYDYILLRIKKLIDNKQIKTKYGNYSIVFDVYRGFCHDLLNKYENWDFLIKYAKLNNIKFKVNKKYEYTPKEMKNYVDKFIKIDKHNNKKFCFSNEHFMLSDNPITDTSQDTSINHDNLIDSLLYIDAETINCIEEYLEKSKHNILALTISPEEKIDNEKLKCLKQIVNYLKKNYHQENIDIGFYSTMQYYKKEEFRKLLQFEKYMKVHYNKDYELKFISNDFILNKQQILNANNKISEVVNYLRKSKLSPYEKILYVHKLLSEKEYYPSDRGEDQDIYATLNSRSIVCAGYSMIFCAIFDELKDPNIRTNIQLFAEESYDENDRYLHAINSVYIEDNKYNIEGYYGLNITQNNFSDLLINFMVPLDDLMDVPYLKRSKQAFFYNSQISSPTPIERKRTYYFNKNNPNNPEMDFLEGEDFILDNTLDFLDTKMGLNAINNAIKTHKYEDPKCIVLSAINECLDKSNVIPLSVTKEALKTVAIKCFNMSAEQSENYTYNVLVSTIFRSIFFEDRENCKNAFAKTNLAIEKRNKSIFQERQTKKKLNIR